MTLHLIYLGADGRAEGRCLAERRQLVAALSVDRGEARGVALLREHHGRTEVLLHGEHGEHVKPREPQQRP